MFELGFRHYFEAAEVQKKLNGGYFEGPNKLYVGNKEDLKMGAYFILKSVRPLSRDENGKVLILSGFRVSCPKIPGGRFFENYSDARGEMLRQLKAGNSQSGISEVWEVV